jgi:hypothetical protein
MGAPQAPVQNTPQQAPAMSTMDDGSEVPMAQPQPQPQGQPPFKLPDGFPSMDAFKAYAQVDPEGAMKRLFQAPEKPVTVGAGSHLVDPVTGKEIYAAPEKPNPNQPFNTDGTPNKAYQAYEREKIKTQQAPAWANVDIARRKQEWRPRD